MSNERAKVISISSRPQPRDRSEDYRPTRRRPALGKAAVGLAVAVGLTGAAGVYQADQNFKHDQRMDVLADVEAAGPGTGNGNVFVVHSGATLRRTPMIPGRTTSMNHNDGGPNDSTKDNIERVVPEGTALVADGVITEKDDSGVTWYGVEVVDNGAASVTQSRDDLGNNFVWFSSELFDQQSNGTPFIETFGASEPVNVSIEGGHFVTEAGQPFAIGQQVEAQQAAQLAQTLANGQE